MLGSKALFLASTLVIATVLALAGAVVARGDDLEPGPAFPSGPALPFACQMDVKAVFWTGTDWERLAKALAADRSACADYWVSIPPLAAEKKGLRVLQDDLVRSYGVHPVAEMTLGEPTGWATWVAADPRRTWFDAGVAFRRAMAAAGYDGPDETWLLNELDHSTMLDAPRAGPPDHPWPAYRRADMIDLLRGLYHGDAGMEPLPGIVEIGINFRHQNIPSVARYKEEAKSWLEDGAFWRTIAPAVRWLAVETYPDVRNWAVKGSSLSQRSWHTQEYVFHLLNLVRAGPDRVGDARALFERAYLPLMNAGYRARGGEQFDFRTGHGNTIVDTETMQRFVSEQVYAARQYANAHRRNAPTGGSASPGSRATARALPSPTAGSWTSRSAPRSTPSPLGSRSRSTTPTVRVAPLPGAHVPCRAETSTGAAAPSSPPRRSSRAGGRSAAGERRGASRRARRPRRTGEPARGQRPPSRSYPSVGRGDVYAASSPLA